MTDTELATLSIVGILIVLDWVSGLAKAAKAKDLQSEKMRQGLWHKTGYLLVIALAEVLDHGQIYMDLGIAIPVLTPVCVYISVTEISSILENASALNPELQSNSIMQLFRQNDQRKQGKHQADTEARHEQ